MAVIDINNTPYIGSPLSLPGDNTSIVDNKFSLMPDTLGRFNTIFPEVTTPFSDGLLSGEGSSSSVGTIDPLPLDFDSESASLQEPISADIVDVAETAANGSPEVPWIFDDKSVTELIKNPIWGNGLGALGTTTSLSGAGQVAALLSRFSPLGIGVIAASTMLRQNESLNTGPNTFNGLTPEQRALATLPGFTFPLDGQINPSSSTPPHTLGKAYAYKGGNLDELPGTVSSPLEPPPTGLEGGSSTANVDPVTLDTSAMLNESSSDSDRPFKIRTDTPNSGEHITFTEDQLIFKRPWYENAGWNAGTPSHPNSMKLLVDVPQAEKPVDIGNVTIFPTTGTISTTINNRVDFRPDGEQPIAALIPKGFDLTTAVYEESLKVARTAYGDEFTPDHFSGTLSGYNTEQPVFQENLLEIIENYDILLTHAQQVEAALRATPSISTLNDVFPHITKVEVNGEYTGPVMTADWKLYPDTPHLIHYTLSKDLPEPFVAWDWQSLAIAELFGSESSSWRPLNRR